MNIYLILFVGVIFLLIVLFNFFLLTFDKKLKVLENQIILLFEKRTNLVPSLYEITKEYLSKHDEVFQEILKLRNIEFANYEEDFTHRIQNEIKIHHELNFIFKVIQKHPKIQRNGKYLLVKDLFLENSAEIGKRVEFYKIIISKLNFYLIFKNFTLLGIFINIKKRNDI